MQGDSGEPDRYVGSKSALLPHDDPQENKHIIYYYKKGMWNNCSGWDGRMIECEGKGRLLS